MKLKLVKEIILPYAVIQLFEPRIIRMEITKDITITKKEAEELNLAMRDLGGGEEIPYLLLATENTQFDSSSRAYAATAQGSRYQEAEALIVRTLAHRLLADLYLKINKPVKPCRVFQHEEDGIEWLMSEFVNKKKR
jgi:hypothetical protein